MRPLRAAAAFFVCAVLWTAGAPAEEEGYRLGPSDLRHIGTFGTPTEATGTGAPPPPAVQTFGQVIVERPTVADRAPGARASAEDARIADTLRSALLARLRAFYVPTTAEGPGVVLLRTWISGIGSSRREAPGLWANTGATYIQAKLRAARSRGNPLAGAVLIAEAYDTGTGRRLGELTLDAPITTDASQAEVTAILETWAQRVTVWMTGSP